MAERELISFDYAVKYVLRGKEGYAVLSGFLSELMGRQVVVDDILESETNAIEPGEKINRVDIKAKIDDGELAIFEIQFVQESDFFGKVLYGVCKTLTEQVGTGKQYFMRKIYSINIVYGNRVKAKHEYLFFGKFGGFKGVHFEDESIIRFAQAPYKGSKDRVDIHPEYYLILPDMFDETLRGKFDEWVYVLKNNHIRDDFTAAGIQEARVKLNQINLPPDKRKKYEKYLEARRSINSATEAARDEGIEIGTAKGVAEGVAETTRKFVLNMRDAGLGFADIVRISKLSEQEVNDILKS